jgi:hypothetical protein
LVHLGHGGIPVLTVRGEQTFTAMESGDDYIPELDDGQWADG